ncbi:hypothetical protein AVEN_11949-1 [Araneus ventricosus]|uniref:Uncharacterized protein n=1 Tax=Araneus ventricosus TaxID=182803 RepID=A0A4Y2S605_ARAVE|nr:hypothetical protein AVEN_11949-1 [Araneus ventricosus]
MYPLRFPMSSSLTPLKSQMALTWGSILVPPVGTGDVAPQPITEKSDFSQLLSANITGRSTLQGVSLGSVPQVMDLLSFAVPLWCQPKLTLLLQMKYDAPQPCDE